MKLSRPLVILAVSLASLLLVTGCSSWSSQETEKSQEQLSEDDETKQVTVLYVADLHAQLQEHTELFWEDGEERMETAGGFARVSQAISEIRQERDGDVLVLDAGDTIQGSGEAALTEGAAVVSPLNAIGLDAGIPGNWEVAYGADVLRERLDQFDHDIFAANLRDEATGERLFEPYIIREVAGVKVAVIGYTDPDVPERQPPAYSTGLSYTGPEELPGLVEEVRREHGAEVVMLMSHIGLSKAIALTDELPVMDAHLSGDTHERTYEPIDRDGTWVVEPGAFGSFLGRMDLWVRDGEVVDRKWELIELSAEKFGEDEQVLELVEQSTAPVRDELDKKIGHTHSHLARYNVIETNLDHVLADALRETTGTDIAMSNGFRFGHPVVPGPIRESDLWRFYPIVTNLKTGEVTGAQLREFWESELENVFADDPAERFGGWIPRPSGMKMSFLANAEKGERVQQIWVNGELLDDDKTYTVTACEREGEPQSTLCRMPDAKNTKVHELNAHQAVRQYLGNRDYIQSSLEGRVIALDLPQILRTQL